MEAVVKKANEVKQEVLWPEDNYEGSEIKHELPDDYDQDERLKVQ